MAGSNSTSRRRHCSQPVASAIVFLHFNGSLLPSQRLKWEEVSRLPPPYRSSTPCGSFVRFAPKQLARSCEASCIRFAAPPPIQFSKTPAKWMCMPVRLWRRGLAAERGRARSRIGPLPYKVTTRAERANISIHSGNRFEQSLECTPVLLTA